MVLQLGLVEARQAREHGQVLSAWPVRGREEEPMVGAFIASAAARDYNLGQAVQREAMFTSRLMVWERQWNMIGMGRAAVMVGSIVG
jgi:hypothetical protein